MGPGLGDLAVSRQRGRTAAPWPSRLPLDLLGPRGALHWRPLSSGHTSARRSPRHPVHVHAASQLPATCLDQFLAQGGPSGNICLGDSSLCGGWEKGVAEFAPDASKGASGDRK